MSITLPTPAPKISEPNLWPIKTRPIALHSSNFTESILLFETLQIMPTKFGFNSFSLYSPMQLFPDIRE